MRDFKVNARGTVWAYVLIFIYAVVGIGRNFYNKNYEAMTAFILAGVAYATLIVYQRMINEQHKITKEQNEFIKEVCNPVIRTFEKMRKEGRNPAPPDGQSVG